MALRFERSALSLVATAIIVGSACAPPKVVVRAQRLLDAGDYPGAIAEADRGLAQDGGLDELQRIKIRAALYAGDSAEAVQAYLGWRRSRSGKDDEKALTQLAHLTLWRGLVAPSAEIQMAAIAIIADHQIVALADEVTALIASEDDRVAATAAVAVLRDHPQAASVAAARLRSPDPEARAIVVAGIAHKILARAAPELRAALSDPDARVRIAAIGAVKKLASREDTSMFATLARTDPDDHVRAHAGRALAQRPHRAALEVARALVLNGFLGARLAGLELAAHLSGDGGRDVLRNATNDDDLAFAMRAAVLLGRGPSWQPLFQRALVSPKWPIRAAALSSIRAATDEDTAKRAADKFITDPNVGVRLAAARLLVRLGSAERAKPIFLQATSGAQPNLSAAIEVATRYREPAGLAAVGRLATAEERSVRAPAIASYKRLNVLANELLNALADPSPVLRMKAAGVVLSILDD